MTTLPKFTETEDGDDDNARAPLTSLIDLGDLRDEAARVMTGVTLTQLYDAVKRRDGEELTRKPDSYVANLLIDEASSVVVSDTLTTQIEKGREFRLSIELVTQFPEQMKEAGNREVHLNVLDNIDSPPVGKIAVDADIAEVLSYEALATVKDYPTIGLNDFVGWYIKRDHDDIEAIKAGDPQRDRVARLGRDYDEIHDRLERTLYPVTTNKTPSAFQRWEPCRYDKSKGATVWQDEPPTPGHANFRAVPAWGDIDLADDIKPQRGALDTETQAPSSERSTPTSRCMPHSMGLRTGVYVGLGGGRVHLRGTGGHAPDCRSFQRRSRRARTSVRRVSQPLEREAPEGRGPRERAYRRRRRHHPA
jgi:hypothetical protein